jgi:hypothetical protein
MPCDLCAQPGATEWLESLDPDRDEPVLAAVLRVCDAGGGIAVTAAAEALAAAELVASAAGEAPDDLPQAARDWVERHGVPDDTLVERALRAVRCVALDDALREAHDEDWCDAVRDLRFRLGDILAA